MSQSTPSPTTETRALIERATALARQGRIDEARAAFGEVLQREPDALEAHAFLGADALQARRFKDAVAAYETCVEREPGNVLFRFNLGSAREKDGDLSGAIKAYLDAFRLSPRDGRLALFAGAALEAAGRREDAATIFSLGDDVDRAVRRAKDRPDVAPELRERSAVADRVMRAHFTRLHALAVDEAERRAVAAGAAKPDLSRVRSAIWPQTHDGPVAYRTRLQRPTIFYAPDLEPRPVTPRDKLAWAPKIEAAAADIRGEYLAAVDSGARMSPYVDANTRDPIWRELRGRLDWSSLHLFKNAEETPFAKLFPKTLKALEAADIPRVEAGKPIEMFFSRLAPGAHIPPHVGAANNRITVHLPLIVPSDCAIRVGEETHTWREGVLFAFDDSFEHEAWNRSNVDRVVLIFEAHHPDLRPEERQAIELAYEMRGRWLKERRIPSA